MELCSGCAPVHVKLGGARSAEAYAWVSNRDGDLGSDEKTVVESLFRGLHTIALSATDSDRCVAVQSVRLWVGSRVYLPVILRQH